MEYASTQSSEMERLAEDAEREVDDLKKAEYMSERIGEVYDGIISSVTAFGLFVELPNTIEGLVHISTLSDDYYVYDERHLSLVGERTKKIHKLGDEVTIKVDKVDLDTHEIYFKLLNSEKEDSLEEVNGDLVERESINIENKEAISPVSDYLTEDE